MIKFALSSTPSHKEASNMLGITISELKKFIQSCKNFENEKGYLSTNFFDINFKSNYKFVSGPFLNFLFKIIYYKKNKFLIEVNNKKIFFNNNESNYNPRKGNQ